MTSQDRPIRMKRFVTIILAVALTSVLAPSGRTQEIYQDKSGLYYTRDLSASVAVRNGAKLVIKSASTLSGELEINADSAARKVSVTYVKRAKADSRSKAIDFIDLIAVDLDKIPDGVRLQLRAPNPAPWSETDFSGSVVVSVSVPPGTSLEIDAMFFDVNATGPFADVLVPSSLGRIEVSDINGRCHLVTANRRVVVENVVGRVSAETTNSTLTAVNIRSFDDLSSFRNSGGDIRIDGFTGELNVRNTYGRIEIFDYEPIGRNNVIRGRAAPVVLELRRISDAQVVLNNRLEDIDISVPDDLSAVLSLAVEEDGRIDVNNLKFRTDLVQKDRLSIVSGKGDSFISGSISGRGNIYVRGVETGED